MEIRAVGNVHWVGLVARRGRRKTTIRNVHIVFADTEFLTAKRPYNERDPAGKSRHALGFRHAIAVAIPVATSRAVIGIDAPLGERAAILRCVQT
jgi:hypothetical protein